MIKIFIPSKDRACQLDLLLRSIQKNFPDILEPTVMFTSSNDDYAEGYNVAMERHGDWVDFIREKDVVTQFYKFLDDANDIVGLFTDDSIFYRMADFDENIIRDIMSIPEIWSFNLRLGKNITIVNYVTNQSCPHPKFEKFCLDKILLWKYNFTDKFSSYFAFPTSFDGCFYHSKDLLNLANRENFGEMIKWEHMICNNGRQQLMGKDYLTSPLESCLVVQQVNSSHHYGHYTNHTFNRSLETLNKSFISGKEINIDSMDFSGVNCCHGEIKFEYSTN